MADNVPITPGSGYNIASDEISGVHHQRVKLSLGTDGTAVDAVGGAGAATSGTTRVVTASDDPTLTALALLATSAQIGEVQASPTAHTLLDRLKALLTGIVLAAGTNVVGKFGIDQTTDGTTNLVAAKQSGTWTISIAPTGVTLTSRSGTLTNTNAQQLMAANSSRKWWFIQNNSAGTLWVNVFGGIATLSQPSIKIAAGDYYECPPGCATGQAISIIGDAGGLTFTAGEC